MSAISENLKKIKKFVDFVLNTIYYAFYLLLKFHLHIRGGGGSPAFCRSLQQIGQCGSGKKRQKAASTIKSIAELLSAVDLSGTSNDGKITCYILVSE